MKTKKSIFSTIFLLILCVVLGYLVYSYFQPPRDSIQLTFFDVGQGDAALAVTPRGQTILIDGGPDDSVVSKLDNSIPFYSHKIDAVVLTHPHADHVAGLISVAEKYQIGTVYMSGVTHTALEYLAFLEVLNEKAVSVQIVQSNDLLDLGDGIKLDFLFPLTEMKDEKVDNLNNSSVITRLSWGDSSVIFMGDLESEAQSLLLASNQDFQADIIKVAHHGSKNGINLQFLNAVDPKYAVISVGQNNDYGHPSADALAALSGQVVYRTDYDGDVIFELTKTEVIVRM